MPAPVSRRHLLGAAAAGAATTFLTACSRASRADSSGASGPTSLARPSWPLASATLTAPTSTAGLPTASAAGSAPTTETTPATSPRAATEIGAGSRTGSALTLTFHGAGDLSVARSILAVLATYRTRVTVLAVGNWLEANPGIAAEILAGGHELGNHTWTHPALAELSEDAIRSEIVRCRDLLQTQTGSPGRYFRQSSSQHSTALIRKVAAEAGYRYCLSYDIDGLDWTDPGPAAITRAVSAARAGSIVSLHLGHQQTVSALPGILTDLHKRGLRPVTAKELLS